MPEHLYDKATWIDDVTYPAFPSTVVDVTSRAVRYDGLRMIDKWSVWSHDGRFWCVNSDGTLRASRRRCEMSAQRDMMNA